MVNNILTEEYAAQLRKLEADKRKFERLANDETTAEILAQLQEYPELKLACEDKTKELERVSASLTAVRKELSDHKTMMLAVNNEAGNLQNQLAATKDELAKLQQRLVTSCDEVTRYKKEASVYCAEMSKLQDRLDLIKSAIN